MAGSITVAAAGIGGNITRYTVTWLSDASGDVSGNSFPVEAGHLMQVRQIPNAAGTQPTDQYDVTVLDANSFDVLVGGGANISNAGPTYITPVLTTGYPIFVEAGNLRRMTEDKVICEGCRDTLERRNELRREP